MKESYYVRKWEDGSKNLAKIDGSNAYQYIPKEQSWVENQALIKIAFDMTDYDEISKDEVEKVIIELNKEYSNHPERYYKKIKEYNFRDIVGHYILMKNTKIVKKPNNYSYIDEGIENLKKLIIKDTKEYYTSNYGYDEENDFEGTFSLDALNEEMTTRKVTDLYEPLYGYVGIEKERGFIIYLLGNKEDKLKYVYAPTYFSYTDKNIKNVEIKIIDDEDFQYTIEFSNQIQNEEERDEHVIKTREIKEIDEFRLDFSPDFVNCIVPYKNADYTAKVKLKKYEKNTIFATYHNQEGILEVVNNDDSRFLLFKPLEKRNEQEELKSYINSVIAGIKNDYAEDDRTILNIIRKYHKEIENSFIKGDLPFEIIIKIMN